MLQIKKLKYRHFTYCVQGQSHLVPGGSWGWNQALCSHGLEPICLTAYRPGSGEGRKPTPSLHGTFDSSGARTSEWLPPAIVIQYDSDLTMENILFHEF